MASAGCAVERICGGQRKATFAASRSRRTGAAAPSQHYARDLSDRRGIGARACRDLDVNAGQTGHRIAAFTNKVRVSGTTSFSVASQFEAPGMIADIHARQDSRLGQIMKIPKDRNAVESLRMQFLRDLRMANRPGCLHQFPQDSEPRCGSSKTGPLQ
jgi:hypothetical protein